MSAINIDAIAAPILERLHLYKPFLRGVEVFFTEHPVLNGHPPILHSLKSRVKDPEHLKEKIRRKIVEGLSITPDNVFNSITDVAGIRVMHLYQQEFEMISQVINEQITRGDWVLFAKPKAYTWDPESRSFFEGLGLDVHIKESFYTSIHYVVRPRADSEVSCEIQVRTLFEEIWGEIDHQINYPVPTESLACREQLRVLARLTGAGSRLADSIFRVHREKRHRNR